jgi:K+-sensing histidine kinase KdpD
LPASSLAIERAQLAEQARQAHITKRQKLQTALLNSILTIYARRRLIWVLSSYQEQEAIMDDDTPQPDETAREETDRLNRLVGNLLNMARINPALRVNSNARRSRCGRNGPEQVSNRLKDQRC